MGLPELRHITSTDQARRYSTFIAMLGSRPLLGTARTRSRFLRFACARVRAKPSRLLPLAALLAAYPLSLVVHGSLFWLAAAAAIVLAQLHARGDLARALRIQLARDGIPICTRCGYDLRGLAAADRAPCPECGKPARFNRRGGLNAPEAR